MLERSFFARCEGCQQILNDVLKWEVAEDYQDMIDWESPLAVSVKDHHMSCHRHNLFLLYNEKSDSLDDFNREKNVGFLCVSTATFPSGEID